MSGHRSNGTWTRKKGVRRKATQPLGRLHRPRSGRSPRRTGENPRIRRGHQGGSRDPRTWRRLLRGIAKRSSEELIDRFERTEDPIRLHMATVMISFLIGLFVGEGKLEKIQGTISILSDGSAYLESPSGGFTVIATQGSDRPRRADISPRTGRTRCAPRAIQRRRAIALSHGPSTTLPT